MNDEKKIFARCKKCDKIIIERKPNGLWYFRFGKSRRNESSYIPVEMYIHGSLQMRCLRRECRKNHPDHWNRLTYLPATDEFEHIDPNSVSQTT